MSITWVTDDTVRVENVITDFDDSLLDPDSNTVVFYDPFGANMGTVSAVKVGAGTYYADYAIPAAGTVGTWRCSWKALVGTYPARESLTFQVCEG
jgi:hypothetical protein